MPRSRELLASWGLDIPDDDLTASECDYRVPVFWEDNPDNPTSIFVEMQAAYIHIINYVTPNNDLWHFRPCEDTPIELFIEAYVVSYLDYCYLICY